MYSHFSATYDNNTGDPFNPPVQLSGTFDLYANIGQDVDWNIGFGVGTQPVATSQ